MGHRLSAKDLEIIKLFGEFVNLRPSDLTALTGRRTPSNPHVIARARLRALRHLGYAEFQPDPDDRFGENAWFLTQKGWDLAWQNGFVDAVRAPVKNSNKNVPHDLRITDFHLKLKALFGERLHWRQVFAQLHDRWGAGADEEVNLDAFFWIVGDEEVAPFFLENQHRLKESGYRNGDSELVRKYRALVEYKASGAFERRWGRLRTGRGPDDFAEVDTFRVLTILPCERRVDAVLKKLRDEGGALARRRFVFCSWENAGDLEGRMFRDPAEGPYSIREMVR